jgi:hypothetical protein
MDGLGLGKLAVQNVANAEVHDKGHQDNIGVVRQRQECFLVLSGIKEHFKLVILAFLSRFHLFHFEAQLLDDQFNGFLSRIQSHVAFILRYFM